MRAAAPQAAEDVTIQGRIVHLFFQSPTFTAGVMKSGSDGKVKFSGKFMVAEGDDVCLIGHWAEHPKYGRQFDAAGLKQELPLDVDGLAHYLATDPAFQGIGPERARRIAETFGATFDTVIREDPQRVAQVAQLKPDVLETLRTTWVTRSEVNSLSAWLGAFGLTHRQITRLVEHLGHNAKAILQDDPYELSRLLPGFGFTRVDEMAQKIGVAKEHPARIAAVFRHLLQRAESDGHCWLEEQQVLDEAFKVLCLDTLQARALISTRLDEEIAAGRLYRYDGGGRWVVALPSLAQREMAIIRTLLRESGDVTEDIAWETLLAEEASDLNLSQREAALCACRQRVSLIAGAAGSGKSYTVAAIHRMFSTVWDEVVLAAPTGKAAKRLEQLCGTEAKTVHRLLEYNTISYGRTRECPIEADAVIVDECFDYKQIVLTEHGWDYIGRIVNKQLPIRVWARNPVTGMLELKPIIRWLKHPAPDMLLKITASRTDSKRHARLIRCTPDHKVLTPYGYRRAGELRVGEEVLARGYQLTAEQRSILVGGLLGDAGMPRNRSIRTSPQVMFSHGEKQRAYLEFKQRAFGGLAGKLCRAKSGYTDTPVWRFSLAITDDVAKIAAEMVAIGTHPSGRRRWAPTNRFLEWLDEQALAIWYLDNGSSGKRTLSTGEDRYSATLHTERFSHDDVCRLAAYLQQRFRLDAHVKSDSRGYWVLRFNTEETRKLFRIIQPYVPACMSAKIETEGSYTYEPTEQPDTCVARIQRIETCAPTQAHVYDLEVADYHNYIAGNIVVSNCSMMDVHLAWHLLDAIDFTRTRLILVGDPNQLPPVGPGNLLRDLLARRIIPTTVLDQVVRQAGVLKENCTAILHGEMRETAEGTNGILRPWYLIDDCRDEDLVTETLEQIVRQVLPRLGLDPVRDVQVLTPTNKGPLGTRALNILLQRLLQEQLHGVRVSPVPEHRRPTFYLGDKVMQTRNNYTLDLMNGAIGIVRDIVSEEVKPGQSVEMLVLDVEGREVRIPRFSDEANELMLAYASTVHKAQGSEFPVVIAVVHRTASFMLNRNLLYTAVTRARQAAIIIGDRVGIQRALDRRDVDRRRTFLSLVDLTDLPKGGA